MTLLAAALGLATPGVSSGTAPFAETTGAGAPLREAVFFSSPRPVSRDRVPGTDGLTGLGGEECARLALPAMHAVSYCAPVAPGSD